jgi:uncharacterized protein YjeT (DUF2065 family)
MSDFLLFAIVGVLIAFSLYGMTLPATSRKVKDAAINMPNGEGGE